MSASQSQDSFWHGRPVLITGCNGFVGSWLSAALVERGARIVGLFRTQDPESELVRSGLINQITAVYGELADYPLLEQTLAEYEIDTVFHLAGQTIVGVANRSPLSTYETNVRGTWLLLEAIRHTESIRSVVVASSEKAYGEPVELPYLETHPLQAHFPYAVSKSCADLIAQSYAATYNLPIAITRCSNLYGGGDLNWDRLLPGTIRSVLNGEQPVIRSDGSFKRDYLYVADAVEAYLTIARHAGEPGVCGQPFNFGVGVPATALEAVKTVIAVSDRPDLTPIILDEVVNEIQDEYLSPRRAMEVLGWEPRYSLELGVIETMAWYRDYLAQ
ncbi:MAG: GDP-mannose 4,6-dehydratase [Chloroflexota bacterium]